MRRVLVLIALLCAASACSFGSNDAKLPITGEFHADLADPVTGAPYDVDFKFTSEATDYGGGIWKYTYSLTKTSANTKPVKIGWTALPGNGPAGQINATFVSLLPPVIDYSNVQIYDGGQMVATNAAPAYVPQKFTRELVSHLFKQNQRNFLDFSDGHRYVYFVSFLHDAVCGDTFNVYRWRPEGTQRSLLELPPDSKQLVDANQANDKSELIIQSENPDFGDMRKDSCQDMYSPLNEVLRFNGKITAADIAEFNQIMSLTAFSLHKLGPRSQ